MDDLEDTSFVNVHELINRLKKAQAEIAELKKRNAELESAADLVLRQRNGVVKQWAGMWGPCTQCKTLWAYGGNWNEQKSNDKCGYCLLSKLTKPEGDE